MKTYQAHLKRLTSKRLSKRLCVTSSRFQQYVVMFAIAAFCWIQDSDSLGQTNALPTTTSTTKAKLPDSDLSTELKFQFDMEDKTRIIGKADWQTIEVDLGFGSIGIPIDQIRSIKRKIAKPGTTTDLFVIDMLNRDRYTGKLTNAPVKVRFLGGTIALPMDQILSCRFFTNNSSPDVVFDDLILYYNFDGDEKATIKNLAGGNHNAVKGDTISRVDSRNSRALKFTGQRALLTKYHKNLCPKRFTFSCWLKPTHRNGQYTFVGGMTKHDGWRSGFALVYMQGDKENVYFYVDGYDRQVVKAPLPINKWTHLTGTFDGKQTTLYVNGKRVGSAMAPSGFSLKYDTDPFALGGETSDCYWTGEMDEVSLYRRAFNTREVKELYESTRN